MPAAATHRRPACDVPVAVLSALSVAGFGVSAAGCWGASVCRRRHFRRRLRHFRRRRRRFRRRLRHFRRRRRRLRRRLRRFRCRFRRFRCRFRRFRRRFLLRRRRLLRRLRRRLGRRLPLLAASRKCGRPARTGRWPRSAASRWRSRWSPASGHAGVCCSVFKAADGFDRPVRAGLSHMIVVIIRRRQARPAGRHCAAASSFSALCGRMMAAFARRVQLRGDLVGRVPLVLRTVTTAAFPPGTDALRSVTTLPMSISYHAFAPKLNIEFQ